MLLRWRAVGARIGAPESDLLGMRAPSRDWRDPWDENRVKLAWSESADFVGQPLIQQPD
jgi:hypothetical protein